VAGRSVARHPFDALLALLDPDRGRAGEKYVQLRHRLVRFFDWRGVPTAEDCADTTLDRVARRLAAGVQIEADDPALYAYGVARNVLREHWAVRSRDPHPLDHQPAPTYDPMRHAEEAAAAERRAVCLESCLSGLDPASRSLIVGYYQHRSRAKIDNRRELAQGAGLSVEALRVRLHRIRAQLLACMKRCLSTSAATIPTDVPRQGGGR
jgi:RNA polymerase sigma factor (sigma-70 family)